MTKSKLLIILTSAIMSSLLIAAAFFAKGTIDKKDLAYKGIYVDGINVEGMSKEKIKELIDTESKDKVKNKKIVLSYNEQKIEMPFSELGVVLKSREISEKAVEEGKNTNIAISTYNRLLIQKYHKDLKTQIEYNEKNIKDKIKVVASKINVSPKDASVTRDNNGFVVNKGVSGISVKEDELEKEIKKHINNDDQSEIKIPVNIVEPKVKEESLYKINTKLSTFTTYLPQVAGNRSDNIRLALKSLNGAVILPGEIFSMDKRLGNRDYKDGYKDATIFVGSTASPGLAGGICQVVSTTYNAVLLANQKIVERSPHSVAVTYVDAGKDATIAKGLIDLKFQNVTKSPMYIEAYSNGNVVTVSIYGEKNEDGISVSIASKVTGSTADSISTETYKNTYKNGQLIKTELISKDKYKRHG